MTLIAMVAGIIAVNQPWYRIVAYSHFTRLGYNQVIFEDGETYKGSVCDLGDAAYSCFVSFGSVILGIVIGFGALVFLIVQTTRPSLHRRSEKVKIIATIILTLLAGIFSYISIGNNWVQNRLPSETTWYPDVGFSFCLFAGILYTVGAGIEFYSLWKVLNLEGQKNYSDSQGPVYVMVPTQPPIMNTYLPSGAYQLPAQQQPYPAPGAYHASQQQQAYPSFVVPPNPGVPIHEAPLATVTLPPLQQEKDLPPRPQSELFHSPRYEDNTATSSASQELENMFGVSYHWTWEQVAEWVESKGYGYAVVSRFKKLSIDGRKMHSLTFQSLETELLIDDVAVQAKLIRDIQGLRPSSSGVGHTRTTNAAANFTDIGAAPPAYS
ncbi:hypothetical protein HDU76_013598 [Blyttiomyces sp. JEL0837]|nr:hypothetical protein HDU76_013598 [Blyttiomyces sp. JEL0837]